MFNELQNLIKNNFAFIRYLQILFRFKSVQNSELPMSKYELTYVKARTKPMSKYELTYDIFSRIFVSQLRFCYICSLYILGDIKKGSGVETVAKT